MKRLNDGGEGSLSRNSFNVELGAYSTALKLTYYECGPVVRVKIASASNAHNGTAFEFNWRWGINTLRRLGLRRLCIIKFGLADFSSSVPGAEALFTVISGVLDSHI